MSKFSIHRQLGFASGTSTSNSYFGSVPNEFAMDNVNCSPSDNTIQDCEHLDENGENCSSSEGAGVICTGNSNGNNWIFKIRTTKSTGYLKKSGLAFCFVSLI